LTQETHDHALTKVGAISTAYALFGQWAGLAGHEKLNQLPGLFHVDVGGLEFTLNAHAEEIKAIPPFCIKVVTKGGFIPALLAPNGGFAPPGAEDEIIETLQREIRALGAEPWE
jgi:hypothetical protein